MAHTSRNISCVLPCVTRYTLFVAVVYGAGRRYAPISTVGVQRHAIRSAGDFFGVCYLVFKVQWMPSLNNRADIINWFCGL